MDSPSAPQDFKSTTSIEVTSNAVDRDPVSYVNFGVYKKNIRGRYQYRKLQFDFKTQTLWNVKGETEKEIKFFRYADIRAIERDIENPLSFHIFYRNTPPYHIYAQSRRDAELMCESLENIIANNKVGMDTTCNLNIVQIKSGVAMLKNQPLVAGRLGFGWTKRWIELYKWQLLIKKEDTNTKPMIIKSLYHVPIAKFTDKTETNAVGKGVQFYVAVMFDDEQFTMRFDTAELRDEWFLAFLNASQEDQELINVSKEAGKGKEDLSNLTKKELEIQEKTTAEVATLRAELAVLDRQTKETNDERQKILKEVAEIKEHNNNLENEIKKLSVDIVTSEDKQKSITASAASLQSGIAENNTKKDQLEQEIVQSKAKIESLKQEIEAANQKVKEKQGELAQLGAQNTGVIEKKHAAEAALKEAQLKLDQFVAENTEKATKIDTKKATIASIEAEIAQILEQTKEYNRQREANEQAIDKIKEQTAALTQQKATVTTSLQSLQEAATASKTAYEEANKTKEQLERDLQDKKETRTAEALLNDLDDADSDDEQAPSKQKKENEVAPVAEAPSSVSLPSSVSPPPSDSNEANHSVAWELPQEEKKEEEKKEEEAQVQEEKKVEEEAKVEEEPKAQEENMEQEVPKVEEEKEEATDQEIKNDESATETIEL